MWLSGPTFRLPSRACTTNALRVLLLLPLLLACLPAADRTVAITIDDLPFAQSGPHACRGNTLLASTRQLLRPLREQQVPVTAFVVGNNCPALTPDQRRTVLREWQDAGATLGNHTFSHLGLNEAPIAEYERDILRADAQLRSVTGQPVHWFRSPFLQTGSTPPVKARLERFLSTHGYRQAAVTLDNSDWLFANVYADALDRGDHALAGRVRAEYLPYLERVVAFFEQQSVEVVGREMPQILLLHANRLNADLMADILAMFRRRGYRFVTLEFAMADPAYEFSDTYVGTRGISWLRRWALTKAMPDRAEPADPDWLRKAFAAMRKR